MGSSRRSRLARRAAPALRIRYATPVSRLSSSSGPANLGGSPAHPRQDQGDIQADAPTPGASEGRPDGNKGAKKGKHADAAIARVQESIEHCLADAQARAVLLEEKTAARWSSLLTNSAIKLDLLRTNVAAKKRNTDLAFLMGGADMLQSTDEKLKAWYMAERGLILNQLPTTATPTPAPTPTPTPRPSDDASTTPGSTEAAPTPPSPRTPTPPTPEPTTPNLTEL
nr:proline-rich transmembrane protein 2-like [Aegilops tauschii subsp. strangulata]